MSESNVLRQHFGDISPAPAGDKATRDRIQELAWSLTGQLKAGSLEEDHSQVTHHFSKGVYCREIFMPKGSLIVGKIHKTAHMNIISQGDISVRTQFGSDRFKAPHAFKSEIGTQRAVYAHEDTIWTTIHPTELTDVDEIESEIIAKSYKEIEDMKKLTEGES